MTNLEHPPAEISGPRARLATVSTPHYARRFPCSSTYPSTNPQLPAPAPQPAGFDAFWQRTLKEARGHDLDARFTEVEPGLALVRAYDVEFSGFGGHRIRGWFLIPRADAGPLPCVVQYIGYGGGRLLPHNWLLWPTAGYATLVMDTRGQSGPDRPETPPTPSAPAIRAYRAR